jgi:hypothetical protein
VRIGLDASGAGCSPDEALYPAMNREALGPELLPFPDDVLESDRLPFDAPPIDDYQGDAGYLLDDHRSAGELPDIDGRR